MNRKSFVLLVTLLLIAGCVCADLPKNTIFLIGDGMGFEQVKAAGMYLNGQVDILSFELFPYNGQVTTHSANSAVTDSAAGGTALATGVKVNNGVVSMAIPGNGKNLPTMLEQFKAMGKKVGLVTTAHITHATPAVFAAHNKSRNKYKEIAKDYLEKTKPHVMLGGAKVVSKEEAKKAGYTVVQNRKELLSHKPKPDRMLWGQFGKSHMPYEADGVGKQPHLTDMTKAAIKVLENNDKGFFLMVEGARIDHAGHANHLKRNVYETVEFAKTVQAVVDWAKGRKDTLIVVTADHETGGLKVVKNNGKGNLPDVTWSTGGHTGANVPVYATGKNAERFTGLLDNTDIHRLITQPEVKPAAKSKNKVPEKEKSTIFTY